MHRLTRFLDGKLRLLQPDEGYRFSLDAPLLADFIRCRSTDTLLEIGTGNGIIPLILLRKKEFRKIYAVELQESLAGLARRNVELNGGSGRIEIVQGDIRSLGSPPLPPVVDGVFANPPYRRVGHGRLNPHPGKAAARHELFLTLSDLMAAARARLGGGGDFFLIHLWEREAEVRRAAEEAGLFLRRQRPVYSLPADPTPRTILLHFRTGPGTPETLPPLHVYEKQDVYSREFQRIISA